MHTPEHTMHVMYLAHTAMLAQIIFRCTKCTSLRVHACAAKQGGPAGGPPQPPPAGECAPTGTVATPPNSAGPTNSTTLSVVVLDEVAPSQFLAFLALAANSLLERLLYK